MNGFGVQQNFRRGFEIFRRGAEADDPICMFQLARCYEAGVGTSANPKLMREWYEKAAEAGNAGAAEWCKKNNVQFTPRAAAPN